MKIDSPTAGEMMEDGRVQRRLRRVAWKLQDLPCWCWHLVVSPPPLLMFSELITPEWAILGVSGPDQGIYD